jgi:hypothetical protein
MENQMDTFEIEAPDGETCLHLRPHRGAPPTTLTVAVYCGLPSGRARVPSRDEVIRFCLGGHHGNCPGYRKARLREAFATGLA